MTPLDFVSYPYSHSLLLLIAWGLAFGWLFRRRDPRALIVLALLVVSHWVLDFVTHRPDMPLYPGGGPKLGLSLWNSFWGTVIVEVAMFLAGAALYFRATRPRDRVGVAATFILLAFLLVLYIGDAMSHVPPPSVAAIAYVGLAMGVIFTAWGSWADAHREARGAPGVISPR
jgi:hypothetical protein